MSDTNNTPDTLDTQAQPDVTPAGIVLDCPIVRGTTTIDQITLRRPMAGELRGVSLLDLMQMDLAAVCKVLPRISSPTLTGAEINRMDPADLTACAVEIAGFLLQKQKKQELTQFA